ncbi:unnamed protein product, partial [Callosobruchus maculatus]
MGKHSKKHRRARKVKKLLSAMLRECEDSSNSSSSATESDSLSDQECRQRGWGFVIFRRDCSYNYDQPSFQ